MSKSDSELWQEILEGSSTAWSMLIKRYQPLVYAVATRSGLSMSDAADCFQQTWVALFQNRKRVSDPSRLSAWLVTTAKREAIRLRRIAGADVAAEDRPELIDAGLLPDEEMIELERQSQLETALAEIDQKCRKLLEAFFFAPEEQSYEQIAASLGMSINSLGPIRRRCLERLKQTLTRNGYPVVRTDD